MYLVVKEVKMGVERMGGKFLEEGKNGDYLGSRMVKRFVEVCRRSLKSEQGKECEI